MYSDMRHEEEHRPIIAKELAIEIRHVRFQYGYTYPSCLNFIQSLRPTQVLDDISLSLPRGKIYGLLGASGCGKTTLLRCCLGRLMPNSGIIKVLGKSPLSPGHKIPGKLVGYMPQELALYGNFTPLETLRYFGMLYGMSQRDVTIRAAFLLNLLDLHDKNKLIMKLSGGQQRRVSFCVALLHEPPLLILDEPTVGVDPLLRASIWKYLMELSLERNVTIVITTHYIEEARQAHIVGLMRHGSLLAEGPPEALCSTYQLSTLEDVFLQLCYNQQNISNLAAFNAHPYKHLAVNQQILHTKQITNVNNNNSSSSSSSQPEEVTPLIISQSYSPQYHDQNPTSSNHCNYKAVSPQKSYPEKIYTPSFKLRCWRILTPGFPSFWNILALFLKNFLKFIRNIGLLIFQFFLPSIQIILFCFAVGRTPFGLPIAVCNQDVGLFDTFSLSHIFLNQLDNNTLNMKYYQNYSVAYNQVEMGNAWAVMHLGENFSLDTYSKYSDPNNILNLSNETIKGSFVNMSYDMSNFQIYVTIQEEIAISYQNFLSKLIQLAHGNPILVASPINTLPPVYGDSSPTFTEFVAPGMMISISFGIAVGLTAISLIIERKEGLIDRGWVAGVGVVEMVTAQVLLNSFIHFFQVILMVLFALFAFQIPYHGSLLLVVSLIFLEGFSGMSFGLLISALATEEISGLQITAGVFYPIILMSGIIWPLEAMPVWLRSISNLFPTTLAAKALRSIITRGWGLTHPNVWQGYIIVIGWIVILLTLATIGLKIRK